MEQSTKVALTLTDLAAPGLLPGIQKFVSDVEADRHHCYLESGQQRLRIKIKAI